MGFTLIELLAVVSIIGLLSLATLASYQAIAKDVRRAGAVEEVKAALDRGRGQALQSGRPTLVAFRPVVTAPGVQQLEVVVAQFSGSTYDWKPEAGDDPAVINRRIARFEPMRNVVPTRLAPGIGVGLPGMQFAEPGSSSPDSLPHKGDDSYLAPAHLPGFRGIQEAPGVIPAVLYTADGTVTSVLHQLDCEWCFIDFDRDRVQKYDGDLYCNEHPPSGGGFNLPPVCPPDVPDETLEGSAPADGCWVGPRYLSNGNWSGATTLIQEQLPVCQWQEDDEPLVMVSPYLVVFDEREVREELDPSAWINTIGGAAKRGQELSDYMRSNGRFIHFNRYTGVAMEASSR